MRILQTEAIFTSLRAYEPTSLRAYEPTSQALLGLPYVSIFILAIGNDVGFSP